MLLLVLLDYITPHIPNEHNKTMSQNALPKLSQNETLKLDVFK